MPVGGASVLSSVTGGEVVHHQLLAVLLLMGAVLHTHALRVQASAGESPVHHPGAPGGEETQQEEWVVSRILKLTD